MPSTRRPDAHALVLKVDAERPTAAKLVPLPRRTLVPVASLWISLWYPWVGWSTASAYSADPVVNAGPPA